MGREACNLLSLPYNLAIMGLLLAWWPSVSLLGLCTSSFEVDECACARMPMPMRAMHLHVRCTSGRQCSRLRRSRVLVAGRFWLWLGLSLFLGVRLCWCAPLTRVSYCADLIWFGIGGRLGCLEFCWGFVVANRASKSCSLVNT